MGSGNHTFCERGELLMSNYLVTDTDMTSVADAIRTKGGTSASLAFPTGFVNAINDIPSGGGANVNVQILGTMPYDVFIPIGASQSGNTVSIPSDSMFVIAVYGLLDMAPTTGTVTKEIIGGVDPAVVIHPGENGGTITLEGT